MVKITNVHKRHGEDRVTRDELNGSSLTVLYIAGSGRTGSTILANTLGQLDDFFAAGELWNIWRRGLTERRKCGCGSAVDVCPVWSAVLQRAFGCPPQRIDANHLDALARKRLRAREIPRIVAAGRAGSVHGDEYRETLTRLYHAVREVTRRPVIVDSSKSPMYAALLATLPGVRVQVVHLIRDARAAAFSHGRLRDLPDFGDQRLMRRERPLTAARRWAKGHAIARGLLPGRVSGFVTIRYEDFIDRPAAALGRILALMDRSAALPLVGERAVRLDPTHSISGNPARFRTGIAELRLDDEWRTAMPARDRALVTAVTWPLLIQYRYPVLRTQRVVLAT
ncbi:MAG: sulfotransferase [Streptosporangiales bacterium]|nr:sulfotransferase [Streptosporangiales bacterium]